MLSLALLMKMEFILLQHVSLEQQLNTWRGVCFCFLLCFLCLTCYFNLKQNKNQAIKHWPFLGALPSLLYNSSRIFDWITETFLSLEDGVGTVTAKGPVFSNLEYVFTCHPQNLEYILKDNFSNFPKGSDFNQIFEALGDGILNADSESWRLQRRMIHTLFKSDFRMVVAETSSKVVECELVRFLDHVMQQGTVLDLQNICARLAFDINMAALCGREEGYLSKELPHNELAKAMDDGVEAILYRHVMPVLCWKFLRFLNVGKERNLAEAKKTADLIFGKYISCKRERLSKGEDTLDLLARLVKWSDELSKDDVFIRDFILNLFFAGKDTLASSMAWFFWMVAKTPSVERKIIEELKSVVEKKNKDDEPHKQTKWPCLFKYDDIKELVYLHAALYETLRLCPSVPFNSKGVIKEDVLPDGTVVKPGTQIVISYYSEGKMPWIWGEDSLDFKPERWIDDTGKLSSEHLSNFFAFNVGPRSCLGKEISFRQMKVCVAAVLFNFHLELVEGHKVVPKAAVILTMKDGLLVKVHQRVI